MPLLWNAKGGEKGADKSICLYKISSILIYTTHDIKFQICYIFHLWIMDVSTKRALPSMNQRTSYTDDLDLSISCISASSMHLYSISLIIADLIQTVKFWWKIKHILLCSNFPLLLWRIAKRMQLWWVGRTTVWDLSCRTDHQFPNSSTYLPLSNKCCIEPVLNDYTLAMNTSAEYCQRDVHHVLRADLAVYRKDNDNNNNGHLI